MRAGGLPAIGAEFEPIVAQSASEMLDLLVLLHDLHSEVHHSRGEVGLGLFQLDDAKPKRIGIAGGWIHCGVRDSGWN